jgi:peptidoglycan/LPS O-acetylase OafA/YrhL
LSRILPGAVSPNVHTANERRENGGAQDRVPALDGVRGLAILAVLIYHFMAVAVVDAGSKGPVIDRVIAGATRSGWIGVDLFFVLSGFLITGILLDAKLAAGRYFRNFYARRVLRIFPAYYGFLLVLFVFYPLFQSMEHAAIDAFQGDRLWFLAYLANFRYALDNAKRADFGITGPLWSLSVEEQFYIVWPAVVLLLNRRGLMAASAAAIVGALLMRTVLYYSGANKWWGYTMMPTRMDALAAGALIAAAIRDPGDLGTLKRWITPVALGSAAIVFALALWNGRLNPFDPWMRTFGYTALAFVFAGVVVAALTAPAAGNIGRMLSTAGLRTLGKYSYAMYIVHAGIAWTLFRRIDVAQALPAIAGSHLPGESLFVLTSASMTFAVAWLSWHLIESRFLKLKRHFAYAPDEANPPAGATADPVLAAGD